MANRLYDAFVAYYLKSSPYKGAEQEFLKETSSVQSARKDDQAKDLIKTKEITGYDYLKTIAGGGKLFTGDMPEHYPATYLQLKEFIDQSLEEFRVRCHRC